MRAIKDRDYIETKDHWIFCILGDLHPHDRVIAYLKYIPGNGPWSRGSIRFSRIMRKYTVDELLSTIEFLKSNNPEYVFFDWTVGEWMSCVPSDKILKHYCCNRRLQEIMELDSIDKLECKARSLVESIIDASGIDRSYMGISGSILLGIHHDESDIDLIVYGRENFWKVIGSLNNIQGVHELSDSRLQAWIESLKAKYSVDSNSLRILTKRLRNKMEYKGTPFSLHAVKLDEEVTRSYGDIVCSSLGVHSIKCVISKNSDSCFMPAIYEVSDVKTDSEVAKDVRFICCYDGMLTSLLEVGDHVKVCGKVEIVKDLKDGKSYKWIVLGTFQGMGREHISLI